MQPQLCRKMVAVAAALLFLRPGTALPAVEAPTLERGLVKQVPALIKHFKQHKYENVGVLKFLIAGAAAKGLSDNVGTLNLLLARRLEVALVLANDLSAPVGIIRNASAVAARTRGANHRNSAGRRKLFEPDYPLAWGKREVKADAFVTGTAQVSTDLRSLTVSLFAFDRSTNKLAQVGDDFTVRNDAGKLAEMNESFLLRGLFDDGEVIQKAVRVKEKGAKHPLADAGLPVQLDVLYDDTAVPFVYRDGKAFIPEPAERQKVAFRLRRDGTTLRYGIVLKVNGESTIERERRPDLHCRYWVLDAGAAPMTIAGYQIDDKTAQQFRVLSRAESRAREIDYGADVGTITLTVFRERRKETAYDPTEKKEIRDARVVARVKLPQKDAYKALKEALMAESNEEETRGLIVEGGRVESKTRTVKFKAEPIPVMSVTVIYYRP